MSRSARLCALLVPLFAAGSAWAAQTSIETVLFIRHGEKAPGGLGQLSCKGLNRSLALAGVIAARYGRVDAVFAPDPARQKPDGAASYDYVRPLATVEPTAIRFGLPVHAGIGYDDGDSLLAALRQPTLRDAKVLVAWEHHQLDALVPRLVASLGGAAEAVPTWKGDDYDSIWRVTITRSGGAESVAFAHDREGLDGLSDVCPD